MNPVFWLLIILVAVALWFLLAFVFYPLGRFIWRIGNDAKHELEREDEQKEDERKEN